MIEPGTLVVVRMAQNNIFPWQASPDFRATYRQGPQGPGDTFMVDVPYVGVVYINGNSSEFVGIYPAPETKMEMDGEKLKEYRDHLREKVGPAEFDRLAALGRDLKLPAPTPGGTDGE